MGATPVADEVVVDMDGKVNPDGGTQLELDAQVKPEVQQPPPRFTGHACMLEEQTKVVWRTVLIPVLEEGVIVLTTVLV
jgi:hypothetical protein